MSKSFTRDEYRSWWNGLSDRQKEWARAKADWEHRTMGAIMLDHSPVPSDAELNDDGTSAPLAVSGSGGGK
jgi:hypothetical protein